MKLLDHALKLADAGFYVFPLRANSKKPAIPNFPELATRDLDQLKIWWSRDPYFNIGIYTGKFNGEGEFLCAVDVDNKGEKKGDEQLLKLELEGLPFPKTFEQVTPTGGRHLIYKTKEPVKQGVDVLAPGLDIRGFGGYLVGSGSVLDGKTYYSFEVEVADAPEELLALCKRARKKEDIPKPDAKIDQTRAIERAKFYLENEAPLAVEGQHGDQTTFKVAARLKDFGVELNEAFHLLLNDWNERCTPPWRPIELRTKTENAYRYGTEFQGASAPEVIFKPIPEEPEKEHPVIELNKEYAFVLISGKSYIIHETINSAGDFEPEFLSVNGFHDKLRGQTITYGGKIHKLSRIWFDSSERRSYSGLCFLPEQKTPKDFYNLWKGFGVTLPEPGQTFTERAHKSLVDFLSHARENICGNSEDLYQWLIGFFAHLIQKPWEKPQVALVFRGGKGVGKNAFIDRIGYLLNGNFVLASDSRYLTGNFNSHLERCLLFALDEAFWSGDKKAEGRLKDLITGQTHLIERKGAEPYSVKNFTRTVIIGNENWLVPASSDERRFAVFDVGPGKKQNHKFFKDMREGMQEGGYQLLFKFLKEFETKADLNVAPQTQGLADQKMSTLPRFQQWWHQCLKHGRVVFSDFSENWEKEVETDKFRQAFYRFAKEGGNQRYLENEETLGKLLRACLPSLVARQKRREGGRRYIYELPDLAQARKEWDAFIGHKTQWEVDDGEETLDSGSDQK